MDIELLVKNALIEELDKNGQRESALLLKNWGIEDGVAKSYLPLIKSKMDKWHQELAWLATNETNPSKKSYYQKQLQQVLASKLVDAKAQMPNAKEKEAEMLDIGRNKAGAYEPAAKPETPAVPDYPMVPTTLTTERQHQERALKERQAMAPSKAPTPAKPTPEAMQSQRNAKMQASLDALHGKIDALRSKKDPK